MRWQENNIDVSKVRGGKMPCPKCSHDRKHKSDPCLSVDLRTGLFNCHHCGYKGSAAEYVKPQKIYVKPPARLEKLSPSIIGWFEKDRAISNNTLLRFGITQSVEWMPKAQKEVNAICFNYYRDEILVNIKYRASGKDFRLFKDAELVFYNMDSLKGLKTAVIVEGEIDCLSMHEAGIYNCISVPNGASKGNQKLEYLENCWHLFEGMENIVIAVDNDEAGNSLRDELARRLNKSRCSLVDWPEGCKDANEVLIRFGKDALKQMVESATLYPLDGVVTVENLAESVMDMYSNGYPQGFYAGVEGFDEHLSFMQGQLTMVTGIPGAGKDEFVNALNVGLAKKHGWKTGIFGFEEPPAISCTKLMEKHGGKSFAHRKNLNDRLSRDEAEKSLLFVNDYFVFAETDEIDITIDGVISKAEEMVGRYGINNLVISPWNCFEHQMSAGTSETLYVSQVLGKIIGFIKKFQLHCFLIAHPTKMQKDKVTKKYEVPTLYSISGSANFFNKTHNGICVHRDFDTGAVDVYIQKVKFSWLGKIGFCSFNYNTMTRQYQPLTGSVANSSGSSTAIFEEQPPTGNFTRIKPGTTYYSPLPNEPDENPF